MKATKLIDVAHSSIRSRIFTCTPIITRLFDWLIICIYCGQFIKFRNTRTISVDYNTKIETKSTIIFFYCMNDNGAMMTKNSILFLLLHVSYAAFHQIQWVYVQLTRYWTRHWARLQYLQFDHLKSVTKCISVDEYPIFGFLCMYRMDLKWILFVFIQNYSSLTI